MDKHQLVFDDLYSDINGFALSRTARTINDAIEFIYGEIDFESFIALLTLCHPNKNTIFYDLGSGTGKAVLACAIVFDVCNSCGIELFSNLHHCAELQQQRLMALDDYSEKAKRIIFKQGNFLKLPLTDATLVFINGTTFFSDYWSQISKHLEQISPGSIVISTSKALDSRLFITENITSVKMSWGIVDVFIQKRVNIL